ncbi:gliding motility-associated C-terminal domain-containing protein [Cellulophaga sp. HaHa_2_1]|uniref:gliding motility-associated C-terminal domain-containing protein n=1 Tax=Cellulophaga sp. HaHa_2_1 TaxID=2749994 RepID=UPI001C4FFDA0|nr:gliding motility-associated C-terminal domain-containing protein [Cellulophaga sp. HaHa_2_1]QXP51775.1 gliding motility-associated C-terminal domain-containing protein [Cellulophaga sp. HaHa_2_1]
MKITQNTLVFLGGLLLGILPSSAQEQTQNFGSLKIHEEGSLGFHDDLINNGSFDENAGLVGFYNTSDLTISGAFRPIFKDAEIVVTNHLNLEIGVGISNNSNFIIGNIVTPRNQLAITLDYINDAFYTGETEQTKVDGYAGLTNKQNFLFPTGIIDKLRPIELRSSSVNALAKAAYFYEDPNVPSTFTTSFDTDQKSDILLRISSYEYWDLDSDILSNVILTWDSDSSIPNIVDRIEDLRVVGWDKTEGIWVDLGNTNLSGDFTSGSITSATFSPNTYEVITFGESLSTESITLDNYILTPNNDGVNDYLVIDAVALSPNNKIEIYNRWGRIVYTVENYKNLFDGTANNQFTISKNKGLPDGIYFYVVKLFDIEVTHQGYLYLNN